jgi:CBS domain-containing protein
MDSVGGGCCDMFSGGWSYRGRIDQMEGAMNGSLRPLREARDIMEPAPSLLLATDSVRDAVRKMYSGRMGSCTDGVPGLVVLDAKGSLAGLVSQHDVLRAILPAYMTMVDLSDFTWDEMLGEMALKMAAKTVAEVMNPDAVSVAEDAPLMECVDLVVLHNLESVPVLDAAGKVVGVVYVRDLYRAIAEALFPQEL